MAFVGVDHRSPDHSLRDHSIGLCHGINGLKKGLDPLVHILLLGVGLHLIVQEVAPHGQEVLRRLDDGGLFLGIAVGQFAAQLLGIVQQYALGHIKA